MRSHLIALSIATAARVAAAQPAGNMQLDEFHPAMDARGYLTLNGSQVLDPDDLSFGLGSLEWGRHLLAFSSGTASYSVDNVVSATLVGALGVRALGIPFEVGASLPLSIMNGAHDRVDGQGLGDLGVHLKARIAHRGWFGLGALASLYLPTASPRDRFLGEPGVTPQLIALADAAIGPVRVTANVGVRARPTSTFTDTMMGTMGTITTSTELPAGIGVAWALRPDKVELVGEVFGAVPIGAQHGYQPLEALGGLKVYLAKSSYLSIGAGRGLIDRAGSPDLRTFIGIVFEPKPAPVRNARIADDVAPPPSPPPPPPPPAEEPPHELAIVSDAEIVPLQAIEFEFDSAQLRTSSYPVLDSVAKALANNPDITLVEVQGHTDERGDDAYNLALSNRRAASVVAYLVAHGIAPARLISRGYGETRPVASGHDEAAWSLNRRVEFVILSQEH
jgi:outer membrane protein OmpA-like peptidoglycan-associated protein